MGWQPGRDGGTGATPGPDPGPPGTPRGRLLAAFAKGGEFDACPPSAELAVALEAVCGTDWRCAGGSRDELVGLLRHWQAIESWAAAGKLGVLRALIRDDDQPLPGGGYHGDLPEGWTKSLTHEVALALSMPAGSAERLMWLAWNLRARLPEIGTLLAAGHLTYAKAKAVDEAFQLLSDIDAARAEAMVVAALPGKTYGQVQGLAVRAALTVDPESAIRRREDAERNRCRVQLSREESGAVALSGRDLPADDALAAHASVCARARQYEESGAFAGDTRMDQFRVTAYLDLLNGIPADVRIAWGQLVTVSRTGSTDGNGDTGRGTASPDHAETGARGPDGDETDGDDDGQDDGKTGDPGGAGPDGEPGGTPRGGGAPEVPQRLADLVLPLATLLGLAERPGEGHGLGSLDPALCRKLAIAAANSPWSQLCLTVTDADGIAIGHGCAKSAPRPRPVWSGRGAALPARANLTITARQLAELADARPPVTSAPNRPPGQAAWALIRTDDPGPPGGFGSWTLVLPAGRRLALHLEPVPVRECDHRHESLAYQPNATLRHLVQIRDYECTFPPCSRHARESDFEHAVPYDKGGRTCACNAGARSRACHQVKQSPGWQVTQPRPGWHQWQTPAGRTYIQGPKYYPT